MPMKLKTVEVDGKVYAEVKDGKPVYDNDGAEVAFDAPGAVTKIGQLNGEAKNHREAKEAAEDKLKHFEGIDPEAAKKAIETVSNLDAGALMAAGKAEEMKAAAVKATKDGYEGQLRAADEKIKALTVERDTTVSQLHGEKIANQFNGSKFITEKLTLPASAVQKLFGANFKVDGDKVVSLDNNGQPIFSQERPGEPATFDEALSQMINSSPYKDNILKGKNNQGGGGQGGGGQGGGQGGNALTRAEFAKLDAGGQMAHMQKGGVVVDN